jgi:iron complex transport system permease protein
VVLATGFGALINFILIVSSENSLHSLLFWLMGDLSGSNIPYLGTIVLILGFIIAMSIARSLNVLIRGEIAALSLGINIKNINLIIYFLSALLTATAVSIGGTIGFIGLIVPHMLRLLVGSEHRLIIPGSILLGGSLLVCADTAARTLFSPQQMPVGIFTAFIGIPVFLYLLARSYRQWP